MVIPVTMWTLQVLLSIIKGFFSNECANKIERFYQILHTITDNKGRVKFNGVIKWIIINSCLP